MARITTAKTTPEILLEMGDRLRAYRLQQNRTLEDLARDAGVSVGTLKNAEAGGNITLTTVIRVMRALHRLEMLDAFLPRPVVSPLQLAQLAGKERERASPSPGGHRAPRPGSDDGA